MVQLGGALAGHFHIDVEHTRMAISFFRYLDTHMRRVYGSASDPIQVVTEKLAERILAGEMPNLMSVRDIQRECWPGLRGRTAEQISLALENLADRNYVRPVAITAGGPGRPVIRWEINPATTPGF
jgi:putative DNA primase/helicase